MREEYEKQAALLIDVLPFVAKSKVFALKGGTAINFFYLDRRRLSVDIDLHYLPNNTRAEALQDMAAQMHQIAEDIRQAYPGAQVRIDDKTLNALVIRDGVQIKIEPNLVIRGSLLPVVDRPLSPLLEQQTGRTVTATCMAQHEIYAGKLCAALDRQHPRDLFDAWIFLQQHELSAELMNVFIVYLISQGKPVHEGLNPNIKDIEPLYHNQFTGMADEKVTLETLQAIQQALPGWIVASLTEDQRNFLLGFKRGEPDWSLLPHEDVPSLPAVRWKQRNLDKMDAGKRQAAIDKLQQRLESVPYNPQHVRQQMQGLQQQGEPLMPQTPSSTQPEQLATEIVAELIDKGLIDESKQKQLLQKIASGTLKSEDWSLFIELGQKKAERKADGPGSGNGGGDA